MILSSFNTAKASICALEIIDLTLAAYGFAAPRIRYNGVLFTKKEKNYMTKNTSVAVDLGNFNPARKTISKQLI